MQTLFSFIMPIHLKKLKKKNKTKNNRYFTTIFYVYLNKSINFIES